MLSPVYSGLRIRRSLAILGNGASFTRVCWHWAAWPAGGVDQSHGALFDPPGAQARFPASRNFLSNYEWSQEAASFALASQDGSARPHCSMRDCLDLSRCHGRPCTSIHVLFNSFCVFYTSRPEEACIFIPSLDTIDRDKRNDDFVESVSQLLNALPLWNVGKNHVLFHLFAGKVQTLHTQACIEGASSRCAVYATFHHLKDTNDYFQTSLQ
ncbi:uncharacterized protein LOC135823276 [Sycon ciliatum]|uniref:uncharacterized protein LOC135823276 n=1 Tax=Sycon ciliatum TaxID=27933 RepID=UPI0031F6D1B1